MDHLRIKFAKEEKTSKEDALLIKLLGRHLTVEDLYFVCHNNDLVKYHNMDDYYYYTTEDVYLTCCNKVIAAGREFEFLGV